MHVHRLVPLVVLDDRPNDARPPAPEALFDEHRRGGFELLGSAFSKQFRQTVTVGVLLLDQSSFANGQARVSYRGQIAPISLADIPSGLELRKAEPGLSDREIVDQPRRAEPNGRQDPLAPGEAV